MTAVQNLRTRQLLPEFSAPALTGGEYLRIAEAVTAYGQAARGSVQAIYRNDPARTLDLARKDEALAFAHVLGLLRPLLSWSARLPVCRGCGCRLQCLDDEKVPLGLRRWGDDNRFDGPHNTAQDCDGTGSGVHEPCGMPA